MLLYIQQNEWTLVNLLRYIPANFGRLSKLRILELRENSLNSLPKSMERLASLTRLDLSQNQFTEVNC